MEGPDSPEMPESEPCKLYDHYHGVARPPESWKSLRRIDNVHDDPEENNDN
jgi:hypothetical protein